LFIRLGVLDAPLTQKRDQVFRTLRLRRDSDDPGNQQPGLHEDGSLSFHNPNHQVRQTTSRILYGQQYFAHILLRAYPKTAKQAGRLHPKAVLG